MAELRKTNGGMIEITKSRRERVRDLSMQVVGGMGEVLEYVKSLEARVAKVEGKKKGKPIVFTMEKKLEKLKTIIK